MKFAAGIVLVFFVSFGQSVILHCDFYMKPWNNVGIGYEANCYTEITGMPTFIEEVRGTHLSGKGNLNVEFFYEQGNLLTSIPRNLERFFPNLKGIYFFAPLSQVSSNDLRPFRNLVSFESVNGRFTSIPGDLFQHTRQLTQIIFSVPGLESVGTNLLTGLNELTHLTFESLKCIERFHANTPQLIQELKEKLRVQCPA
jgi:hypothetical protein